MRNAIALALTLGMGTFSTLAASDTMEAIKEAARQQAGSKIAEKLNIPSTPAAGSRVYIVSPADGATISGPVTVVFGLSGMGVAPAGTQVENTGHHHLLIDDPTVDYSVPLPASKQLIHFGGGQTETTVTLAPGTHTLQLVFADWKHQSFNPTLTSEKITITVE